MYVVDGVTVNYERLNETVEETTVLTYQCDSGLSLTGPNTISCTNAGVWSTDPQEILCVVSTTETGEYFGLFFISVMIILATCSVYIEYVYILRNSKLCHYALIIFPSIHSSSCFQCCPPLYW